MGFDRLIWRGEIYDVDLGHPVGHEPAFTRPAIVVSTDVVNNGPGEIIVVVPVGSIGINSTKLSLRVLEGLNVVLSSYELGRSVVTDSTCRATGWLSTATK